MKRNAHSIFVAALTVAAGLAGCAGGVRPGESNGALIGKLASGSFHIEGVTSDGYAIVSDLKNHVVNAVNVATGASQQILATPIIPGSSPLATGAGPTALLWHDPIGTGGYAQLSVWSAASGAKLLSSNAWFGFPGLPRVSRDGQHIFYFNSVDAATDALTVDNPAHTAPIVLAKVSNACPRNARYVNVGAPRIVTNTCAPGSTDKSVIAYNLTNGTNVVLQTQAGGGFGVDPTGTRAFVKNVAGAASLVNLDGSLREPVDSNVQYTLFFNDGVEMVYTTSDGKMKRICSSGLPDTIQSSGVGGLWWMSYDSSYVAYWTTQDPNSGNADIRIASTVAEGPPLVVNADGLSQFTGYTVDNKFALYYNATDAAGHVGTFTTLPLGGGPGRAPGVGQSAVYSDWQLTGSKTIFNDQYAAATATTPEHVALKVVDLATNNPATQLVANADLTFAVTADLSTMVYTTSDPLTGGLYTVAIP